MSRTESVLSFSSRLPLKTFRSSLLAASITVLCTVAPVRAAPQPSIAAPPRAPKVLQITLVPATPDPSAAKAPAKSAPKPPVDFDDAIMEWWVIGGVGALLFTLYRLWRLRRRRCPECRARMNRLDREATFAELDAGERTEQLVGDVRYEVWRCPVCQHVVKTGNARGDLGASAAPVGSAAHRRAVGRTGLSLYTDGSPQSGDGAPPPAS